MAQAGASAQAERVEARAAAAAPAFVQIGQVGCERCPGQLAYALSIDGSLHLESRSPQGQVSDPAFLGTRFSRAIPGKDRDYLALLAHGARRILYADKLSRSDASTNFSFVALAVPEPEQQFAWLGFQEDGSLLIRLSNSHWYRVAPHDPARPERTAPASLEPVRLPSGLLALETIPSVFARATNAPADPLRGRPAVASADGLVEIMAFGLRDDGRVLEWAYGSEAPGRVLETPPIVALANDGYAVFGLGHDQRVYWLSADQSARRYDAAQCSANSSQNVFCEQTATRDSQDRYTLVDPQAMPIALDGLPPICQLAGSLALSCAGDVFQIATEWIRYLPSPFAFDGMGGLPIGERLLGSVTRLSLPAPIRRIESAPAWPVYLPGRASAAQQSVTLLADDGALYGTDGKLLSLP